MFELSGVNYEEVLEQGDSILVRVIASSSYQGFELSGLYCVYISRDENFEVTQKLSKTFFCCHINKRVGGHIISC